VSWQRLVASGGDLAEILQAEFGRAPATIGTIRRDGSPRISNVEPAVVDDVLYIGMMWQSKKALDVSRDPRVALRNAVATSTGNERELTLRGRVAEVTNPVERERYLAATATAIGWREPFHLFAVEIESVSFVAYGDGLQTVRLWPQGIEYTRPYP
jgi:hypothetical protein